MARLSRRALVAGVATASLTLSRVAGACSSADAHLFALCAEAMRLDQAADAPGISLDDCTALLNSWQEMAEQIAATPARTPAGHEAKGAIIRHLMTPASSRPDDDETKWDDACVYGPLVWSLVNDLATTGTVAATA